MDILRNILAVIGTALMICCGIFLLIQFVIYNIFKKEKSDRVSKIMLFVSVCMTLLLSPFFYLPA